jgi:hypothetical protein
VISTSAHRRAAVTLLAIACAACQSSAPEDSPPPSNGSVGGSGGGRTSDGGPVSGAGELKISIVAPKPMEPIKARTSSEVRVRVLSVRPGTNDPSGDPVDPTSIVASLRRMSDNGEAAHSTLFGPMPNSEFAAPIDLSSVSSGDYQLIVTGNTSGGTRGMTVSTVRVDAGPRIEIKSPTENGSYKGSVTIQVIIDSAPFGPTMSVEASIGVLPIALNPTGAPNTYEALVEFLKLASPLEGDQVLKVAAINVANTRSEERVRFTIDNRGPEITATEPKEGVVVGGIIRLRAKVSDQSGVLGNSVTAVIGNRQDVNFKVDLKAEGDTGFYSELFDTARLTSCKPLPDTSLCIVFPNLSFRASDRAGNESFQAYDIAVDNQPPTVDLSPPGDLRIIQYNPEKKKLVCSWAFNPIGDYQRLGDMPRDLCAAPQVFDVRARIEDDGNRADGLKFAPTSGVDPATTTLYVLSETSQALVVDVDGDGVCDSLNPKLIPTTKGPTQSNEVLAVRLAAVPPKGAADFTPDPSLMTPAGMAAYPACTPGDAPVGPRRLCGAQPQTIVIGYPAAVGPASSIWSVEPITSAEPWCVGSQFDAFANQIREGWACVAAAATDKLGNTGVSNPLRVWIQNRGLPNTPSCPAPPPTAPPPPNCTGSFNRQSGTVGPSPCRGRTFRPREIINAGALPEGM